MRSRRGEVSFVAIRVGRSNDPREVLGLARELKIGRATALGYLALWEEFILEVGDAFTGRVKGYAAPHIAAKLDWPGSPRRLIDALKRAGVLATHRGVFLHPYWLQSITGQYARDRAELREHWRKKKAEQRAGQQGDVPQLSPGQGGDGEGTSQGTADIDRGSNGSAGAAGPPGPPHGGGRLGAARWEWIRGHHKRPSNSRACTRYLDVMTEADWALCQWVVGLATNPGSLKLSRKKRVLGLDAHKFLATEAYLQFAPEWEAKQRESTAPVEVRALRASLEDEEKARKASAVAYVLAALGDPELTEGEKAKIRQRWQGNNPGEAPPWEAPPAQ